MSISFCDYFIKSFVYFHSLFIILAREFLNGPSQLPYSRTLKSFGNFEYVSIQDVQYVDDVPKYKWEGNGMLQKW